MFIGTPRLFLLPCALLLLFPAHGYSQLPRRLEKCLPYPSLAAEIREMRQEVSHPKVIIEAVTFQGGDHLSDFLRNQAVKSLKERTFDGGSNWIGEVETIVRGVWQDHGYFRTTEVRARARPLHRNSTHERFSVTVRVEQGSKYRLAEIQFSNPNIFPHEELRKLFPLRDGDIFSLARIKEGFDALKQLYGSKGYIDFTSEPYTDIDDTRRRILLILHLDKGPQYRVNRIEILGFNQAITEQLLKSLPKLGEPFDQGLIEDFFKQNKSILPSDASSEDVNVSRDVKNATVDLVFDLRTCPQG